MKRPTHQDLQTTVDTLDWLAALAEEERHAELTDSVRLARAFTAATLAHDERGREDEPPDNSRSL